MSVRKTKEEWQEESNKIHNSEFEIIDVPKSGQNNVNILHKICGNIISMKLNNHLKRYCKFCSKKHNRNISEYQLNSNQIHNNGFIIMDNPKNIKEKVRIRHIKCGRVLEMTMNNHLNHKNGCKFCSKYSLKSNDHWKSKCVEIWGDEFEILQEVNNVWDKVKVKHKLCGEILLKDMSNLIHNKRGCSICSKKEYGSIYIKNFLDKENIKYEQEKKFDDLINPKTGRKLRLDFYLIDMNIAIEVDGLQHYKPILHWGGEKEFIKQIYRDNIKELYLKSKGIKLIRINNKQIKNINKLLWQQ